MATVNIQLDDDEAMVLVNLLKIEILCEPNVVRWGYLEEIQKKISAALEAAE